MQTSVMLRAADTSMWNHLLSFADSVLRGLGRSWVALDDHLLMSMEYPVCTQAQLIEWLSVNETD